MTRRTSIRELLPRESEVLIKKKKFDTLKPIECLDCGNKADFLRKLFELKGFFRNETELDRDQNFVRGHMHKKWKLKNIFFKNYHKKHYVDTAFCPKCGSNKVMYDLHMDDDMFKEMSKMLNIPVDKIKQELAETMSKLEAEKVDW